MLHTATLLWITNKHFKLTVADQNTLPQHSFGQTEITIKINNRQFQLEAKAFVSHTIHNCQCSGNNRTQVSSFLQHIMKEILMMFAAILLKWHTFLFRFQHFKRIPTFLQNKCKICICSITSNPLGEKGAPSHSLKHPPIFHVTLGSKRCLNTRDRPSLYSLKRVSCPCPFKQAIRYEGVWKWG